VVLLPKQVDGLASLEGKLTADNLNRWLSKLSATDVDVSLPKFQMTSQFELSGALTAMGMTDAFVPGQADFLGIAPPPQGNLLYISKVVHKAFVDVSETGTKAAAATGVAVNRELAIEAFNPPPVIFDVDHPFIFLIRDRTSGAILFMGRVTTPNG